MYEYAHGIENLTSATHVNRRYRSAIYKPIAKAINSIHRKYGIINTEHGVDAVRYRL